ncbi:helix-turn-helix domain-containing protein [Aestuariibius sp. HNIBRBA575]|uniref:helix-turn-helix domain-containing protein n=1 Tax=Aestuariibius sp. HNIBRBA575 TaxID=3233343 RepID=UPI0034A4DA4A
MSIIQPELEFVDRTTRSIRYLEHGWPSDLCRWHYHEEYELHLITSTRGKAFIGDYIGEFTPGTLYLTGPNLPHNWITDTVQTQPVDVRDMLVQFSHSSIEALAQGFPEFGEVTEMLNMAQSGIEFVGFNPTFARGHMESIRDNTGPERILAFIRFLVRLNEHAEKKTLSVARLIQPSGGSRQARIGEVVDHILQNYADDISVETAADMAGMSPASFSRNFQTMTGHRFVGFVNRVRVGQACALLLASDDQITSICYQVGFQNLANFNRHFRKMKGMTPSQYRDTAQRELMRSPETLQ